MPHRRAALLLGILVACAIAIGGMLYASPFVTSLPADDHPGASTGESDPNVAESPIVRLAIAGDTGTGDAAEQATAQRMIEEGRDDPYDALLLLAT
ncbi:hypothetical protein [Arthrobacter sp. H20]|uniref:hypothetical protein n=1 Tax=Arthrobacter sp. H20 TaxID=1267981 RepID=UPI000478BA02|nr:hypothetical protein [Arthrobacter sp. H20]